MTTLDHTDTLGADTDIAILENRSDSEMLQQENIGAIANQSTRRMASLISKYVKIYS